MRELPSLGYSKPPQISGIAKASANAECQFSEAIAARIATVHFAIATSKSPF
jgi:hypothetical protein